MEEQTYTDLTRAEHGRRSLEIRWDILFTSAGEEILIGDEEGLLIGNPRFEQTTGISSYDYIGVRVGDLPFRSIIDNGVQSLQEIWDTEDSDGKQFIWRIFPDRPDGMPCDPVILDASLRFVEMDGRRLRFLIARNITEEMRLREEQEHAIIQIDQNLGQLAALNDEIKNPLTLIAAWTELDDPPSRSKIMAGVRQIKEIIDRVDAGYIASEKVRKYLRRSIEGYPGGGDESVPSSDNS